MHTEPNPEIESAIKALLEQHPGLTRAQLLAEMQRVDTLDDAAKTPFPGPLREAFASAPPVAQIGDHKFTLQPVSMALLSALEQIESTFVAMVAMIGSMHGQPRERIAKAIEKRFKTKTETLIATAWCFVTPIETVESQLEIGGAFKLRKTAKRELGQKLSPVQFQELNGLLILHYIDSFSTAQKYEAKKTGGDGSFISAPTEAKTASVGASTSTAP